MSPPARLNSGDRDRLHTTEFLVEVEVTAAARRTDPARPTQQMKRAKRAYNLWASRFKTPFVRSFDPQEPRFLP